MIKSDRRSFLKKSALGAAGVLLGKQALAAETESQIIKPASTKPIVVSTWNHGMPANKEAWKILNSGGRALDAVEAGVRVVENDPDVMTVGLGGFPDREGYVTLDACIMDENGKAGSVAFLRDIKNPISVARKVMEDTPHVMLVGEGAKQFALESGFKEEDLLTPKAEAAYKEWLKKSKFKPIINIENHDTISMVAIDQQGQMSGACTTSGASYKMHGRVGDSPIIGAGLFVDNEIGAACATGWGELVMRTCGTFLVVELMRQGYEPEAACKEAVDRIKRKNKDLSDLQVGYLALRKDGEYGSYAIHKGFNYALKTQQQEELIDAEFLLK